MTAMSVQPEAAQSGVAAGRPFTVPDILVASYADLTPRDEKFSTERPFPITIVPARLLDGLRR